MHHGVSDRLFPIWRHIFATIPHRTVRPYGDMVFSGVRAGSLNFSGGILSFFGGILGNLTVSQILTGSPCVSSSGWEDEESMAQERACCRNGRWGSARGCEPKSNSWWLVPNASLAWSVTTLQVVFDGTRLYIDWPVLTISYPTAVNAGPSWDMYHRWFRSFHGLCVVTFRDELNQISLHRYSYILLDV